jgi:hypothetical protein
MAGPAIAEPHSASPQQKAADDRNKPRRWNHLLLVFMSLICAR